MLASLQTPSRGVPFWLTAFGWLFVAYHLPEIAVRLHVSQGIASVLLLFFFPLAAVHARRQGRSPLQAYGLEAREDWWAWLAVLFLAALIAKALTVAAGVHWGLYLSHGPVERLPAFGGWLSMLLATFVPSLAEDILTRGVFKDSPLARRDVLFVLGTAAVYVANHVWRLGLGWREGFMLLCFGIAYAMAFWRTGTLWAAVGLHWGWNFAGQMVDAVWLVDERWADAVRLLSAGTHLVLAVGVIAVTAAMKPRGSAGFPASRE